MQGDSQVRVLVVDDHDMFRVGLASLLADEPGIEVVGQASRSDLGVRLALELKPDVVLMDLRMPGLDGAGATRLILAREPAIRIVMLTVAGSPAEIEAALLAGACGYLLKETPADEIVAAVIAAAQGASALSPRAAAAVIDTLRRDHVEHGSDSARIELLSGRELEILRLLTEGLDNAQIAARLHISPRTAKNHVSHVLSKLEVSNRVEAATLAVRNRLF